MNIIWVDGPPLNSSQAHRVTCVSPTLVMLDHPEDPRFGWRDSDDCDCPDCRERRLSDDG